MRIQKAGMIIYEKVSIVKVVHGCPTTAIRIPNVCNAIKFVL